MLKWCDLTSHYCSWLSIFGVSVIMELEKKTLIDLMDNKYFHQSFYQYHVEGNIPKVCVCVCVCVCVFVCVCLPQAVNWARPSPEAAREGGRERGRERKQERDRKERR